jgi:signal transduction histidine kinase
MKLWMKMSLICIVVLIAIVVICCATLLSQAKKDILQVTVDNAQTKQTGLQTLFGDMVNNYGSQDLNIITKNSLVKYSFSHYADQESVLVLGGETLYSRVNIQPEALLPLKRGQQQNMQYEADGRNYLIVGNTITLMEDSYAVYIVRDISSVYADITQMGLRFFAIGAFFIIVGIALIILFVRMAVQPLKELSDSAKQIAQGEYSKRAIAYSNDEVGELARDFNSMADAVQVHIAQLEETAERRRLFMSALTHEYRTPLTSVIGYSETLLMTKLPEEIVQASLTHIYDECKRLERLTQKLLALIVVQDELPLKEEPVQRLFENVQRSTGEILHQRGVELFLDCQIKTLPMDMDLMQDLLINLIDNASKASKEGQTITLRAYGRTIEVKDEGVGIAQKEIPRITEPFYMVDKSRNKKKGGSGIGLALAAKIANAHRAKLIIESKPGKGTTVKIVFPELN